MNHWIGCESCDSQFGLRHIRFMMKEKNWKNQKETQENKLKEDEDSGKEINSGENE